MNSDCQLISRMELEKMNQNKIDCCPISNSFGGSMRVNSMLQNAHDCIICGKNYLSKTEMLRILSL